MTATIASPAAKSTTWIFNPVIDLLLCCGGVFWLLVALHFRFAGTYSLSPLGYEQTWLLPLGAVFIANPHLSATFVRLYKKPETRNKLWMQSYLVPALVLPLAVWAVINPIVMALIIRVYAALTFDHTLAQNYGITLMYCYRSKYMLEKHEKLCLKVFYHACIWYAVLRGFTYIGFCPKRNLGYDIPMLGPLPEFIAQTALATMVIAGVGFAGIAIKKATKDKQYLPLPSLLLILTSIAISTSPLYLSMVLFIFTSAYFHSLQYLVITSSYNLRENGLPPESGNLIRLLFSKANLIYWAVLYFIGFAIFIVVPFALGTVGVSPQSTAISLFVCLSFHHFFADAALWKFRDSSVRKNLVG